MKIIKIQKKEKKLAMEKEKQMIPSSQRKMKRREDQEVPYDIVEEILLRLPVKSIIRFKSVSKQWRSTIEPLCFKERHFRFSSIPQILFASPEDQFLMFRILSLDSASLRVLNLLNIPRQSLIEISGSCDGLVCIYLCREAYIYIINPAMRWFRQLPHARFQLLMQKARYTRETLSDIKPIPRLAFAKSASFDYKLVWLYNSDKYNSDAASPNEGLTKCEVFDFKEYVWRYLTCTPSYRIFDDQTPAFGNGSIYWFTEQYNGETKVIVFDLHTETFRFLPKTPVSRSHPYQMGICIFENRLCMSERKPGTMIQEIWSLQSSSEDTWMKIYTIDLSSSPWSQFKPGFSNLTHMCASGPCTPVAICKNKEILLSHRYVDGVVKYDPQKKTYSIFEEHFSYEKVGPYYQSLISHI